jgi:hypothetical protein
VTVDKINGAFEMGLLSEKLNTSGLLAKEKKKLDIQPWLIWSINSVSKHLLTNVWVTECFGLGKVKLLEENKKLGLIKCYGAGLA